MKKFISVILTSAVIASVFTLSACEQNNGEQSSEPSQNIPQSSVESVEEISIEPSKAEITAEQLSQLNATLSSYTDVPEFTCTSQQIDAESISENESIMLITKSTNDPFCSLVTKQFESAANSAGFENTAFPDTDGTPASYNDALAAAINGDYKAVIMFGDIDKDNISSGIEQTQANGIKVISAGNVGVDRNDHYVDYTVPINYQLAGQLLADWAIVKQSGKVNALAINCSDSGNSNAVYEGFAEEFQKYVSSGYCTTLNVSSIEIGNGLSARIKTALNEDPNLNYVVVFSDSLISEAVSAVEQSVSSAKIIATGGSPSAFDSAENNHIEMLAAQSYEWTAYAMVDYLLRVISKSELPAEQDVPVRIVTADSIKADIEEYSENYNDEIDGFYEICFGSAFVPGYSTLWDL